EGTFPLPEAQIDRFLMRVALGYPSKLDENAILLRYERQDPLATLEPVIQAEDLLGMQEQVKSVSVEESVREYMVDVVRATREHEAVELG
ncbi:MAG: AAA family ATPase, partial [Anaerolineae bacterium]|nr:AAA family ATPase [Anaerolineae bacterium]